MKPTKKLTISALVIAIYIVIMYFTQGFAFGEYQIRIATSLYALSYIYPFLIIPLGISNFLSNTLMGGLGPLDMIGGTIVGIIASSLVYLVRRFNLSKWLIALPVIFIPGLLVPVWLSYILKVPYQALAISICIGQVIPSIVGVILVQRLENQLPQK
ncbi:MAG: QueT transporter family protein [Clostridia bacterium]|nr:QueT transporter family protein [Clostridia bacterium]